jgi:CheY-like chemotaxis protein
MTDACEKGTESGVIFSRNNETVLVVEGNPDTREITLQRVEGLGYVVVEAADAPEAISLLTREPDIALVLCDMAVAGAMSAYELGFWVKLNKPHIKAVLTSDHGLERMSEFPVLTKPFSRVELARALGTALYGPEEGLGFFTSMPKA